MNYGAIWSLAMTMSMTWTLLHAVGKRPDVISDEKQRANTKGQQDSKLEY